LRERVDAMAARLDALEPKIAADVAASIGDVAASLRELAVDVARHTEEIDMAAKTLAQLRAEMEAHIAKSNADIAALQKAGGVGMSKPRELGPDEVLEIMEREPDRRLIAVSGHRDLGLQPGDSFDPRARFSSPMLASQYVRAGLRLAPAPV
jgi:hypothetical protein